MPKRLCPFEENDQYIKKQVAANTKARGIRNGSSEKTLQLLYRGASRQLYPKDEVKSHEHSYYNCFHCSNGMNYITKCFYCDKFICVNCTNFCTMCQEEFCKNCTFPNYVESAAVCYSCY